MATTPIIVTLPAGRSGDKLELYPVEGTSIANGAGGDTLTALFAGSRLYLANVTEAITGDHQAVVKSSAGNVVGGGFVHNLTDDTTRQYVMDTLEYRVTGAASTLPDGFITAGSLTAGALAALKAAVLGGGANLITVTVEDDSANLLIGKQVTVYSSAGESLGIQDITDESGQVQFQLNDGTYKLGVGASSGYESHTPEVLTVDGTETPTLTVTKIVTSSPPAAELCTVYTYVKINGTLIEGATLSAELLGEDSTVEDTVLSLQKTSATTDANGYAELFLVKASEFLTGEGTKGEYHISVKDSNGKTLTVVNTTIPDAASKSVQELLSAL